MTITRPFNVLGIQQIAMGGLGLSTYVAAVMRHGRAAGARTLRRPLAQRQGAGSGLTVNAAGLPHSVVDAVVSEANGSRTETARVLEQLAIPLAAHGKRYQGPAPAAFDSKATKVRVQ